MSPDSPIVEEVRKRAAEISASFGDDLHRYCDHLRDVQSRQPGRLVDQITVVRSDASESAEPER